MIEVELEKVVNSVGSYNEIIALKMPGVLAYKISKFGLVIDKEAKDFNKIRNEKLKEYDAEILSSDDVPNVGGIVQYKLEKENLKKFTDEIEELNKQIVKFDLDKIKIEEKFPEVQPVHLIALNWMFEV